MGGLVAIYKHPKTKEKTYVFKNSDQEYNLTGQDYKTKELYKGSQFSLHSRMIANGHDVIGVKGPFEVKESREDRYKKPENLETITHKPKEKKERKEEDIARGIALSLIKPTETKTSLKGNGAAEKSLQQPLIGPKKYTKTYTNMRRSYEGATPEFIEMKANNLLSTSKLPRFASRKAEYEKMADDMFKLAKFKRQNLKEGWFKKKQYRYKNAELSDDEVEGIKREWKWKTSVDHEKQAREHLRYIDTTIGSGSDTRQDKLNNSMIAKKQFLRSEVHKDLAKEKRSSEGKIGRLMETPKTPNVNRLYDAYAQVYQKTILHEAEEKLFLEAGGASWTSPKGHEVTVKRNNGMWRLEFLKRGAKEPLVKDFFDKDDALRHGRVLDDNVNENFNPRTYHVTEEHNEYNYHLNEFRKHMERFRRTKDPFMAARHKQNALEYWRTHIGGEPPKEELKEEALSATAGWVATTIGGAILGKIATGIAFKKETERKEKEFTDRIDSIKKTVEDKVSTPKDYIYINQPARIPVRPTPAPVTPQFLPSPVTLPKNPLFGHRPKNTGPNIVGVTGGPVSINLNAPKRNGLREGKVIPIKPKKKGMGDTPVHPSLLPPPSDNDIELSPPDNVEPIKPKPKGKK